MAQTPTIQPRYTPTFPAEALWYVSAQELKVQAPHTSWTAAYRNHHFHNANMAFIL